jgi:hypothetical protein
VPPVPYPCSIVERINSEFRVWQASDFTWGSGILVPLDHSIPFSPPPFFPQWADIFSAVTQSMCHSPGRAISFV